MFRHYYSIHFSVLTNEPDPLEVPGSQLTDSLHARIKNVGEGEMSEACEYVESEMEGEDF